METTSRGRRGRRGLGGGRWREEATDQLVHPTCKLITRAAKSQEDTCVCARACAVERVAVVLLYIRFASLLFRAK